MATAAEISASGNSTAAAEQKFSCLALTAMVVGSMVGAGIFSPFSPPGRFGAATGSMWGGIHEHQSRRRDRRTVVRIDGTVALL